MATTTPNFGWPVPTSTDLVKDGATAIEGLGDAIDASLLDLKGGTSGQVLAKNSNTDMDFIWVTDAAGDITGVTAGTGISGGGTSGTVTVTNSMATAIDAKGDLIAGTGADAFSRLAIGTNGQLLTADSTAATGMAWTTVSGGGMTLLSTTTLSGASTTISSISGSYKDLYVRVYNVQYDTGSGAFVFDQNGTFLAYQQTGTTLNGAGSGAFLTNSAGSAKISGLSLNRSGGNNWFSMYFPNYSNTGNRTKSFQIFGGFEFEGDCAVQSAGRYRSNPAEAVTTLTFYAPAGSFSGGTVLIYGAN